MKIVALLGLAMMSRGKADEIDDDWDDREWRFAFPDDEQISENQCQGETGPRQGPRCAPACFSRS